MQSLDRAGQADAVTKVAGVILAHFNERWGQGAPVTAAEAKRVAIAVLTAIPK